MAQSDTELMLYRSIEAGAAELRRKSYLLGVVETLNWFKPSPAVRKAVLDDLGIKEEETRGTDKACCPACHKIHRYINGVDIEDHVIVKETHGTDDHLSKVQS